MLNPEPFAPPQIGILGRSRLPRSVTFTKVNQPSQGDSAGGDPEGLYVGGYGTAGPEIVLVEVDEGRQLRATKVTGDQNVPAGTVSFKAGARRGSRVSGTGFLRVFRRRELPGGCTKSFQSPSFPLLFQIWPFPPQTCPSPGAWMPGTSPLSGALPAVTTAPDALRAQTSQNR